MPSFRAAVTMLDDSRAALVLAGEFDLANAPRIVELGQDGLTRTGVRVLVVDLAGVTFMDSTALTALVRLRNSSIELGKQLTLVQVPPRIERLLAITGLDEVFPGPDGDS